MTRSAPSAATGSVRPVTRSDEPDRRRARTRCGRANVGGSGTSRVDDANRESGMAGGEALIFAVLLFFGGSLMILNLWAVIDAKMSVVAASREGARAAVEGSAGDEVIGSARAAALFSMQQQGRSLERTTVNITGPDGARLARCQRVTVTVRYAVRLVALPGIPTPAGVSVRSSHSEIVDPYRSGLPGEARCLI